MTRFALIISLVCAWAWCGAAAGAELRLKSQARAATGIVRLGDVAEIHAAEAWQVEQLSAIELGPAPAPGARRYLRSREIQDALFVRGINQAEHHISGSDRIEVLGPGEPQGDAPPAVAAPRSISDADRRRVERLLVEAITLCLNGQTGGREPWQVTVETNDELVAALAASPRRVLAEGGESPFTGKQSFTILVEDMPTPQPLRVTAEVALPPAVVAVARNLSIGTILHESDLILKPVSNINERQQPFYRLEEVLGQETIVSLPAGAVLMRGSVRRPVVVRRSDAVTLYARSAGLRVRTTARAREDGALGDLIAVESLTNREVFYARVTGIQEVEVFAAPAEATPRATTAEARFAAPETSGVRR